MTAETVLASPCVGICRMDPATGWCLGCARTGDELERWMAMDGAARTTVWDDLPRRKATIPRLGFDLLPWAPATALAHLAELSAASGGPFATASGPRTWLAPALFAHNRELEPGLELPEGYAPLFTFPSVQPSAISR